MPICNDVDARTTRSAMVVGQRTGTGIHYHGLDKGQNFNTAHTFICKISEQFWILILSSSIKIGFRVPGCYFINIFQFNVSYSLTEDPVNC